MISSGAAASAGVATATAADAAIPRIIELVGIARPTMMLAAQATSAIDLAGHTATRVIAA